MNDQIRLNVQLVERDGHVSIKVVTQGKEECYTPEEVAAMLLSKMKKTAEAYLDRPVTNAVISVPTYFNNFQRQATKDAGAIAGLNVIQIINDPSAVIIAQWAENMFTDERKVVAVVDVGGGTTDISIVDIADPSYFEVIAVNGDSHLGGNDFDSIVCNKFTVDFQEMHGKDLREDKGAILRLRTASEEIKRSLTSHSEASIDIDNLCDGINFHSKIERHEFARICSELSDLINERFTMALRDANKYVRNVDKVLAVGGMAKVPMIEEIIKRSFDKVGTLSNQDAVVHGAAVRAAILSGEPVASASDLFVLDVTPHSISTESANGQMSVIIPRNQTVPVRKTEVFSTQADNQTELQIRIYEGERYMAESNDMLGTFHVSGMRPVSRGKSRCEMTFNVDENGILELTATAVGTQKELKVHADKGNLSQEEIDKLKSKIGN